MKPHTSADALSKVWASRPAWICALSSVTLVMHWGSRLDNKELHKTKCKIKAVPIP